MRRPALGLFVLVVLAACDAVGPVNQPPPAPPTEPVALVSLLSDDGDFKTLAGLASGRLPTSGVGTTVFAPDDEAFVRLSPESLAGLTRQAGVLERTLNRLVVTAEVDLDALHDGDLLPTREGTPLPVRIDDEGTVFVGEARVEGLVGSTPDGPVYRISRVPLDHLTVRERLAASPLLTRSLALFESAGVDLTQPGTYFVPLDASYDQAPGGLAAFTAAANAALVRKTLRATVVPDEALTEAELRARGSVETAQGTTLAVSTDDGFTVLGRSESRVLAADLRARGAVIHLIGPPPQGHLTLLERIDFSPSTASFAALVRRAGLEDELSGEGPFTVFAPTEAAFDSIGTSGRAVLTTEADLSSLLARFHVSPGEVPSSAFVNGTDLPTLAGQPIRVRPDPRTGAIRLSRASPGGLLDFPASNGRLHYVRSFLNPDLTAYDQLVLSAMSDFRAAVKVAGYQPLYESDQPLTVVGPISINPQFLRPGFECRALQLVEDHTGYGAAFYTPMAPGFETLSGRGNTRVLVQYSANRFTLESHVPTQIDVSVTEIGAAAVRYVNAPLANGGILHATEGRLRWYALPSPGGGVPSHAVNLPPC